MKLKRKSKKEVVLEKEVPKVKEEKLEEELLESDIGAILNLTADCDNPVSDGKEFKDGDSNE